MLLEYTAYPNVNTGYVHVLYAYVHAHRDFIIVDVHCQLLMKGDVFFFGGGRGVDLRS